MVHSAVINSKPPCLMKPCCPPRLCGLHCGSLLKDVYGEFELSTTPCRCIVRRVLASAIPQARFDGRPILSGRPTPTDGLG